eukprot:GHRQ01032704.1.p1 GENE.GHRQ01032704.1~~GHRQ01032704.1.p1  ORF type:complete len:107 (-),score=27.40 GHRQ01032704.1:157-438(-)
MSALLLAKHCRPPGRLLMGRLHKTISADTISAAAVYCCLRLLPFPQAFVQFADVPSAQKAKEAIHGRMFAGNIVQAFHVSLPSFQSIPTSVTI